MMKIEMSGDVSSALSTLPLLCCCSIAVSSTQRQRNETQLRSATIRGHALRMRTVIGARASNATHYNGQPPLCLCECAQLTCTATETQAQAQVQVRQRPEGEAKELREMEVKNGNRIDE